MNITNRVRLSVLWACLFLLAACTIPDVGTLTPEQTIEVSETVQATDTEIVQATDTEIVLPTHTDIVPSATSTIRSSATNTVRPSATVTVRPTATATVRPSATATLITRTCDRISFNVNGQGLQDETRLVDFMRQLNPCVILIMDNMGLAVRFTQILPNAVVIHRKYSSLEGGQCLLQSAQSQVDDFIREVNSFGDATAHRRVTLYGCSNEPSFGGNTSLQSVLNAEIAFMTYARSRGVTVVSGNFAVGTVQPEYVESGMFHQYLITLTTGNHYLGVHEYTSLFLPFGVGLYSRDCLMTVACVQRNNWVRTVPMERYAALSAQSLSDENVPAGIEALSYYYTMPQAQAVSGALPPYWHLFRVYWLFIYAQEHGIAIPRTILTEGLFDHLDDINRGTPAALDELEARYGMGEFMNDIRGAPSHCRLWREFYYTNQSCEVSLVQQLDWWDSVAAPQIIGVTQFTWSWHDGWVSFDLSTRQRVMNMNVLYQLLIDRR